MVSLSDEERQRFAAYLEQDAANDAAMAEQIEKMGGGPPMEMMAKKMRTEATAARIVAAKLRSIETQTVR